MVEKKSMITARGNKAKENANKEFNNDNVDLGKVYVKLKDGDSIKLRFLGNEDYIEYYAHNYYKKDGNGIFTQPCQTIVGGKCAYCQAAKYQGEKDAEGKSIWKALGKRNKYQFAVADLDVGELRVIEVSKKQAKVLIAVIDDMEEQGMLGEIAFTYKRTGSGKDDTTYTLNPIMKLNKEYQAKFDKFNGVKVEDKFFEDILAPKNDKGEDLFPRDFEHQLEALHKAGFPVEEVFGEAIATPVKAEVDAETLKKITFEEGDLPF